MRITRDLSGRCLTVGILGLLLSGCQLIYVTQLEVERQLRPTETLPNTAVNLESCQVNQPCDRTISLSLQNWATEPWPKIDSGELPPGLSLSIQPEPDQRGKYIVMVKGTPDSTGTYTFQVGLETTKKCGKR
ncbi:MAG: hypothetical protein AAFR58_20570 [Cyanobacteria bacterium J06627_28]